MTVQRKYIVTIDLENPQPGDDGAVVETISIALSIFPEAHLRVVSTERYYEETHFAE